MKEGRFNLAFISPAEELQFSEMGDFHFVLAPMILRNVPYELFYGRLLGLRTDGRRSDVYSILDDGVHEEDRVGVEGVIEVVKKFQVSEMIIPDFFMDYPRTIVAVREFLDKYYDVLKVLGVRIQAVVQGRTIDDALMCYRNYLVDDRISVIGIPFAAEYEVLDLVNRLRNRALNRRKLINNIIEKYGEPRVKFHLLGMNIPEEIVWYRRDEFWFIRSCDSKLALRCAINNIKIQEVADGFQSKGEKLDMNAFLTAEQRDIARSNIKYLQSLRYFSEDEFEVVEE